LRTPILATLAALVPFLLAPPCVANDDWPQFRGPTQQGHSDSTGVPLKWSESRGIAFKTPIPGEGWSSPVVLGGQVWMTTATDGATPGGKSLRAVCVDRGSGKIVHDVEVFALSKLDPKNDFNSYASPTPVLEPGRVYVSFGNYGNACLDARTGRPIWKSHELKLDHKEGPGSSPILYKNLFILHCDGTDAQYVAALDKETGKLAWKTHRRTDYGGKPGDLRKAYDVPLIIQENGQDRMISVAAYRVFCYDPVDGREIGSLGIPGFSVVPRPVYGDGVLYVCTGYMQSELWAVRTDGNAGVSEAGVLWKTKQGVPFKPSIVLAGPRLYMVSDNGIARCLDAKTGEQVWQKRLEGKYTASPVCAEGRVYFCSEQGLTTVIAAEADAKQPKVLAENELDGRFMASPAIAGKSMFLRTDKHLYRVDKSE
jgi:outer membrane protein assembly factor BamB